MIFKTAWLTLWPYSLAIPWSLTEAEGVRGQRYPIGGETPSVALSIWDLMAINYCPSPS